MHPRNADDGGNDRRSSCQWRYARGHSRRLPYLEAEDITAAVEFAKHHPNIADRLHELAPEDCIAEFARRWAITELALFGSVLRDDFTGDSDVDVLVSSDPAATWSLWDLATMADELSAIVGRRVDLVEKEGLRNPFRRQHILNGRKIIYVRAEG
jgi:predicted nucleotidyltransferase